MQNIAKIKDFLSRNKFLKIEVKVKATKNEIVDVLSNGIIKINIKAKPENNKANVLLIKFLAKQLGFQEEDLKIIKGKFSNKKVIKIGK